MKTTWKIVSVAVTLLACVSLAQAKSPGACMDSADAHDSGSHMKQMTKELGLTSAQTAQVKDIFAKNRDLAKPQMDKLKVERKAMHALIHADAIDEAAIRAQSAKVAVVQADLAINRAQMVKQVRALLTPEQVQKFKALSDKMAQGMGERHGKHADHMDHK